MRRPADWRELGNISGMHACSLRVESLCQDGGYDGLKFIGKGGKPADMPLPVPVMHAMRVVADGRTAGPLLPNRANLGPRHEGPITAPVLQVKGSRALR